MRLRPIPLAIPLLTALLLAACGGGSGDDGVASLSGDGSGDGDTTSTTLSEEEAEEALLDWAACMREQGIDMPDPKIDPNGGIQITAGVEGDDDAEDGGTDGSSGPPDRDAFQAAAEECGDPPMVGGPPSEEDLAEMKENALELAECMRDEGIEDFPDPDFSDMGPGSGPGTKVERFDDDDDAADDDGGSNTMIAGPFGEIDLDDPEMKAAFETCSGEAGFGRPGVGGAVPSDETSRSKS